jgi:hypothetical protein
MLSALLSVLCCKISTHLNAYRKPMEGPDGLLLPREVLIQKYGSLLSSTKHCLCEA